MYIVYDEKCDYYLNKLGFDFHGENLKTFNDVSSLIFWDWKSIYDALAKASYQGRYEVRDVDELYVRIVMES